MDRRTFLTTLALTAPALAQPAAFQQRGRGAKPAPRLPPPGRPSAATPWDSVDPMGGTEAQFSDRRHRHQGRLAGHRPARGLEARSRRGLFGAGGREQRALRHVWQERSGGRLRRECRDRPDALGTRHADDLPERCAGAGERPVLVAADRRGPSVHDRRGRPAAGARQEIRQAAVDPAAVERPPRHAVDVRLLVEPDRVPRFGHRAGRRQRPGAHGVPAGRRHDRVVEERFSATSTRRRS